MKNSLILLGGGGHCKSVINSAESSGYMIRGILDLPKYLGHNVLNYRVIGSDDDIVKYVNDSKFIVTLGFIVNPMLRIKLHDKVKKVNGKFGKVVAKDALVYEDVEIGNGTVVLHHAVINAGARLGFGCIINTLANIEHDVEVGDYTHVSTGVMINGNCTIGKRVFVGSGSVIANNIHICNDVIIGCGSIVIKNILESGTYIGNPLRKIK